ncbi:MAG: hypothetical protein WD154_05210 [Nitrosopumilaceae archaeon]
MSSIQNDVKPYTLSPYLPDKRDDPGFKKILDYETQRAATKFSQLFPEVKSKDNKPPHTITSKYQHRLDPEFQQLIADEAQKASIKFVQLFPEINENDDKKSKIITWRDLEIEKRQFQMIQSLVHEVEKPPVYEIEEPPAFTFITLPSFIFELEQLLI